jgi:hypothetical protein
VDKKGVRINKSFIVQRALTMRQMLEASALMSNYMHYPFATRNNLSGLRSARDVQKIPTTARKIVYSRCWPWVVRVLCWSDGGDEHRTAVSFRDEFDPCDYLKAQEFQLKRDVEGYKKSTQDDLLNMKTG